MNQRPAVHVLVPNLELQPRAPILGALLLHPELSRESVHVLWLPAAGYW